MTTRERVERWALRCLSALWPLTLSYLSGDAVADAVRGECAPGWAAVLVGCAAYAVVRCAVRDDREIAEERREP